MGSERPATSERLFTTDWKKVTQSRLVRAIASGLKSMDVRPRFLDLKWCLAVALAAGVAGAGIAVSLRETLGRPADPIAFQRRSDAWKKLDQEWTPAQRVTGPKRARN